ncbi:hypothetical protein EZV62_002877 [Acer yangbiense]|uniref:DYW domain-containing protein n=1 Tax=Acer yangbiense TaxID=1000413 RepID=A0A5C7IYU3_9ROSI|nr:hypothetical protein EZV62_028149 [Acer yangbiense]TXG74298.1 hypothetical protein EZV62_002877 [Acer yangbiense]
MQFMETLSTPLVSLPIQANPEAPTVKSDNQNRPVLSLIDQKLFTASTLSPFSSLEYARKVFDEIPEPNLYMWNTLIRAYSWSPEPSESVKIFLRMLCESPYFPNKFTFPFLIKAATKLSRLGVGQVFHGLVVKSSFGDDVFILNSLIHFYASCGDLDFAYRVFVRIGEKDVVSWNSMISRFVQGGCFDKALELFKEMEAENVKPNAVTKVGVLSACTKMKDLEFGRWVRSYIEQKGIKMDLTLSNAMLDMYAKCGSVEDAKKLFDEMEEKDIVSWTTMIDGYAKLGEYDLGAMDVGEWNHENIKKQRMKLNCHLTTSLIDMYSKCVEELQLICSTEGMKLRSSPMLLLLPMYYACACSHSGLVEEGRMFFNQMEPVYGVVPGVKHYACMVDILGRAGLLEEAVEFIEKMPITPSASVWGALLGACKIHENVELAEQACSRLLELEPENDKALVLLSNIYAKTEKWDNVSELKKRMRVSGLQKERGWSSMEVNGTLHKFLAADNSHPLSKEIYSKLEEIVAKLKSSGHVTNKSLLLQLVDEEDMKEQGLNLHGEKLAIAFGLISTSPSQLIRIVKNLRVCGDCHTVAKLISKLYNREILLRDRYRFHHFSGGNCSCMDYWCRWEELVLKNSTQTS